MFSVNQYGNELLMRKFCVEGQTVIETDSKKVNELPDRNSYARAPHPSELDDEEEEEDHETDQEEESYKP